MGPRICGLCGYLTHCSNWSVQFWSSDVCILYADFKYTMRLWSLCPLRVYFLSEQDTEFQSAVETAVDRY